MKSFILIRIDSKLSDSEFLLNQILRNLDDEAHTVEIVTIVTEDETEDLSWKLEEQP